MPILRLRVLAVPHPHPIVTLRLPLARIKQHRRRHLQVLEEVHAQPDAVLDVRLRDRALQDLATEGPEDDHAEVDVDVHDAVAVPDQALGAGDERVEADAETDLVQDLVGVFGVDPVFDGAGAGEAEA